jgi:hypothetical protein
MKPVIILAVIVSAAASATACGSVMQNVTPSQQDSTPGAAQEPGPASSGLRRVHDPGEVTGTEPAHCAYRDDGKLPDRKCTPGSIDPAVTQANIHRTICVHGYTKTVRPPESQTERFKFDEAYPAYGVPDGAKTELDHLISLELGGSNDASNLWPERSPTPNPKDEVEDALHAAVCSGQVSLRAAQTAIASNWTTAEAKLGIQ